MPNKTYVIDGVEYALVPVEPTPEMLAATSWPGCAATDYEHMLAAAPAPAPVATAATGKPALHVENVMAQGGGVDVEKVMALVEEYGHEMKDLGMHTAEGYALGIMQDEKEAARVLDEIRALLTAAPAASGWIPVSERLPEPGVDVLCLFAPNGEFADSEVEIAGIKEGDWFAYYGLSGIPDYWIPLPPLPAAPAIAKQREGE